MVKSITKQQLMEMLGPFKSVKNAPSRNGYSQAPNQFDIRFQNGVVFQSYNALVGARINGRLYFSGYHDYSNTTSRHTKAWCGYTAEERRKGLEDGTFTLIED